MRRPPRPPDLTHLTRGVAPPASDTSRGRGEGERAPQVPCRTAMRRRGSYVAMRAEAAASERDVLCVCARQVKRARCARCVPGFRRLRVSSCRVAAMVAAPSQQSQRRDEHASAPFVYWAFAETSTRRVARESTHVQYQYINLHTWQALSGGHEIDTTVSLTSKWLGCRPARRRRRASASRTCAGDPNIPHGVNSHPSPQYV